MQSGHTSTHEQEATMFATPLPVDADDRHSRLLPPRNDDDASEFHVEFDYATGYDYACCLVTSVSAIVTAGLALLCVPCIQRVVRKEVDAQRCTVTANRVVLESGWLNRSTRYIPLDRIQDVNVHENIVQRRFGITGVEIQTAGVGVGHLPEAYLLAPRDASAVRCAIMQRRDALMFRRGHASPPVASSGEHADKLALVPPPLAQFGGYDSAVVHELRELKDSVLRIEAQISAHVHAQGGDGALKKSE